MKPPPHVAPNINRYLPMLRELIKRHNAADYGGIKFRPSGQSVDTAIKRVPDTVNWLIRNPEFVDYMFAVDLRDVWKHYHVVPHNDTTVSIEPRRKTKELHSPVDVEPSVGSQTFVKLKINDRNFIAKLTGLAALINDRDILERVTISGPFDPELQKQLEEKFLNIAFISESPTTTIMI